MATPSPFVRGAMVFTGVLVSCVVIAFGRLAYGLILPYMREHLALSYGQVGTLGTVTALGYLGLVMVAGICATRWGGRLTTLLGLIMVTSGFFGMSLSSAYPWLLAYMALLGIGTAFTYTPMVSLIAAWNLQRRGLVIGLLSSGVGLGMLLAGLIVPHFAEHDVDGWRLAWRSFGVVGVIVIAMVFAFFRNPPAAAADAPPPTRRLDIYRNPRVLTVGVLYGIVGLTYIVQSVFMVSYALSSGVSAATAGKLVAANGLVALGCGPAWGWISDRIGRGTALILAMSAATIATAIPVVYPVLPGFIAHYCLLALTISGLFALVQTAGTEQVPPRDSPVAFSYVTLFFAFGQFAGPAMAGWLIDISGFRAAFLCTTAIMLIGIALTVQVWRFGRPVGAVAASPPTRTDSKAA